MLNVEVKVAAMVVWGSLAGSSFITWLAWPVGWEGWGAHGLAAGASNRRMVASIG